MATAAQRDRLHAAIAQFTNDEINAAVVALGDGEHLTSLAQVLNLKKPALAAHPDPASLLRARLRSGAPGRAVIAGVEIAGPCADACIDDLGERADDPAKDDMLEVLPPLVAEFGAPMVTLMLAGYVAMDAPCAAVFDDLLDHDERFVIGPPTDDATAPVATTTVVGPRADDPDAEAKRAKRKEADARKKDAARKQREAREAAQAALKAARKQKKA